ncbi:MAG TPA: YeeE/YedE thiosulfate transporter family protein [Labilithrix sp.]|nr:YeeE/YedE thiosulfate transporter family protein [Labilithrix sp.]
MRVVALVLSVVAGVALAPAAQAQCTSNASSCVTCHETQGLRPVLQSAQPWHADHGFGDLCASCHAGDPASPAKEQAHLGLRHPLGDPAAACAGCHASDGATRAERYRSVAAAAAAAPPAPPAPPPSSPSAPGSGASKADRVLAILAALLAFALYVVLRRETAAARRPLVAWLRDRTWSPYVAGVLLGLVVAFSEVVCGRPIAAAGAFDKLAAYPGRWLFPRSQYYAHVMSPGITWQVWLIVGVIAGSFASSKLSGEARLRWLPDTQWEPRFGPRRTLRLVLAFCGAVLVQVGAGIAGGCTSGLAISGGAVLAPAAFLFMTGMFAGGIPTAWLWYRGRRS